MSAGSPTAYLLWAILSVTFLIFLLIHLWTYDRFQCIKWNNGRQPGAFKRLMTYTYLTNIPLLVVYTVGMARIKYREGFVIDSSSNHLIPTPSTYWSDESKKWLLPLYFCLSFAWALEITTHLEELTFWLFLLHQGPNQRQWFRSWEFRMWYIGSTMAIIGLPLTTLLAARQNLSTTLAWIFLVGSSASTCTTICFFYVLARFPHFIEQVKAEGAEPSVVVRLVTFYQLNRIRVVFRFLFTIPFFILAADGIQPPYPIIEDLFASDLLFMLGAIGSFISSGITLFVFFPRSITEESGYSVQERVLGFTGTDSLARVPYSPHNPQASKVDIHALSYDEAVGMQQFDSTPISCSDSRFSFSLESGPIGSTLGYEAEGEGIGMPQPNRFRMMRRSMPSRDLATQTDNSTFGCSRHIARRHSDGGNLCLQVTNVAPLKPANVSVLERRPSQLDRYLLKFTSPIDLPDDDDN